MNQIAPPSPARSGGATSPHCGIVPRPAASHPEPARGMHAGPPRVELTPAGLPSSRGLSWTRRELAYLRALRAAGRTLEQCAATLRRPLWGVSGAVKRYALPRTRERKWTAGEFRTLLRLKVARKTIAEIAAELGRTPRATSKKWLEMTPRLPVGLVAEIHRDMIRRGGKRTKGGAA